MIFELRCSRPTRSLLLALFAILGIYHEPRIAAQNVNQPELILQSGSRTWSDEDRIAIDYEGKRFIVQGADPTLWTTTGLVMLRQLFPNGSEVQSRVAFVPDSDQAIGLLESGRLVTMDLSSGNLVHGEKIGLRHSDVLFLHALSKACVIIGTSSRLMVWDHSRMQLLEVFGDSTESYVQFAVSPNGKYFCMSSNKTAEVFRCDAFEVLAVESVPVRSVDSSSAEITEMACSNTGQVAVGFADGRIIVCEGKGSVKIEHSDLKICGVCFNATGSELTVVDVGSCLKSWSANGVLLHSVDDIRKHSQLSGFFDDLRKVLKDSQTSDQVDEELRACRIWYDTKDNLYAVLDGTLVKMTPGRTIKNVISVFASTGIPLGLECGRNAFLPVSFFGDGWLWNTSGHQPMRINWNSASFLENTFTYCWPVAISDEYLLIASLDGKIKVRSLAAPDSISNLDLGPQMLKNGVLRSIRVTPDRRLLLCGIDDRVVLFDVSNLAKPTALAQCRLPEGRIAARLMLSADGKVILIRDDFDSHHLAVQLGAKFKFLPLVNDRAQCSLSDDGKLLAIGNDLAEVDIVNEKVSSLQVAVFGDGRRCFDSKGAIVAHIAADGTVSISRVRDLAGQLVSAAENTRKMPNLVVSDIGILDQDAIVTLGLLGEIKLTSLSSGGSLCTLIGQRNKWLVSTRDGQFDSSTFELEDIATWRFPEEPDLPITPDALLRDYYQPDLLRRLLKTGSLPAVRSIDELNFLQPSVDILGTSRAPSEPHEVSVRVVCSGLASQSGRDERRATGVYDLRLFRDGQLVGRIPSKDAFASLLPSGNSEEELVAWRAAALVCDSKVEEASVTFRVRLPHNNPGKQIELSAYAFNRDRVKSATARMNYTIPADLKSVTPKALLVAVGVDVYQGSVVQSLNYSAADARLMLSELGHRLKGLGYDVHEQCLVSARDLPGEARPKEQPASKANIQAAVEQLKMATPDDLVILAFSGHGYTVPSNDAFYLFPHDLGNESSEITPEFLKERCISSEDLTAWVSGVDAGEFVLIVDTCHSAAAIDAKGEFKPGPMGSRGLGQLAYDKGMRILTASQAGDVAIESGEIQQGLLSYALLRDGLQNKGAAIDGRITLGSWLEYAERRVPSLYAEVLSGRVLAPSGENVPSAKGIVSVTARAYSRQVLPIDGSGTPAVQTPRLFQYAKDHSGPLLLRVDNAQLK